MPCDGCPFQGESRGLGSGSGLSIHPSIHPSVSHISAVCQGRVVFGGQVGESGGNGLKLSRLSWSPPTPQTRVALLHVMAPPPLPIRTRAGRPWSGCLAGCLLARRWCRAFGVTGTTILRNKLACNQPVMLNHLSLLFHSQPFCFAGRGHAGRFEFCRRLALRCCVAVELGSV